MSFLSRQAIAAANFDFEGKKLFRALSESATVAAAGSASTDATALTAAKNLVTASDGTKGVILPKAEPEMAITVVNTVAASDLKVYPAASAQINALTATTGAFTIPGGQEATFHCDVNLHWYVSTGSGASAAELEVLNGATAGTGVASKAVILDADGAFAGPTTADAKFTWSVTSDSTSGSVSVEPFVHNTTMTGAGGVGGRARFELDTNVALGGWANALKGQTEFGASGSVTGLASGVVGEITLSAGTTSGTYAAIEAEFNVPSGASLGTNSSLMYLSVNGADKATFDTSGYLFTLAGVTAGTSKMLMNVGTATALADFTKGLRVKVAGVDYVVPLITAAEFAS